MDSRTIHAFPLPIYASVPVIFYGRDRSLGAKQETGSSTGSFSTARNFPTRNLLSILQRDLIVNLRLAVFARARRAPDFQAGFLRV